MVVTAGAIRSSVSLQRQQKGDEALGFNKQSRCIPLGNSDFRNIKKLSNTRNRDWIGAAS